MIPFLLVLLLIAIGFVIALLFVDKTVSSETRRGTDSPALS